MIGLIVARSQNNVIGKNGKIPWMIPGELEQFRELTMGNVVIMGRKTFEEIGHPLPHRDTIVVSTSKTYEGNHLCTTNSLKDALRLAGEREVFIAGGSRLYAEAIPFIDVMYITEVHLTIENGDTFFPAFDRNNYTLQIGETCGEEIKYTRTIYRRIYSE